MRVEMLENRRLLAAPVTNNDFESGPEETSLFVPAPGVLGNDFDPDGDSIRAVLMSAPSHGSLLLFGDGSFQFDPAPGYEGPDSFTYVAVDPNGEESDPATVNLFVNPVGLPPEANPDSYTAAGGLTLVIAPTGVLANDFSPEGLSLTAELLAGPSRGALVINANGSFSYTPEAGFNGEDSFTYRARDSNGLGSIPMIVTIDVGVPNVAPTSVDDAFAGSEDKDLFVAGPGVLANDTDPNGDTLSAFLVTAPGHGTLTLSVDGSFIYTPDPDFAGTDSFTYRTSDGRLAGGIALATIVVRPANDAPVAEGDAFVVDEDGTLSVAAPGVLGNDSDSDGDAVLANLVDRPQHAAAFALNADGSFSYTPAADFIGTDSFTYRASDAAGGRSATTAVTITVTPVNDAPAAADDAFTMSEDITLNVAAPGVLLNDTDTEGAPLSAVLVAAPADGVVTLNADGSFSYTPNTGFTGTDSFTYRAGDGLLASGIANVTIVVRPVTDAPVAADDRYSTEEDLRLVVPAPGVLVNDGGAEVVAPQVVLVSGPLNGVLTLNPDGSFSYTPSPDFSGTDSFTYRASANALGSNLATVTIDVSPVAEATVQLFPASDAGASSNDQITRVNTPTFLGVTRPGLRVVLSARLRGSAAAPIPVGQAVTDSSGAYTVASGPLPDGQYEFFVEAFRADGLSTGRVGAGTLLIDTAPPVVVSAVLMPRTGQLLVSFSDESSGLATATLSDVANYSFTRRTTRVPRAFRITGARALPTTGASVTYRIVLDSSAGRRIRPGRYLFAIISGGVSDVAGNALDGEFSGLLPSGNRAAGGDFAARFSTNGRGLTPARPTTVVVPILTLSAPGGPLALAARRRREGG